MQWADMFLLSIIKRGGGEYKLLLLILGMYTDGVSSEEQSLFIIERHCFSDLVEGLSTQCPCGKTSAPWVLESVVQV